MSVRLAPSHLLVLFTAAFGLANPLFWQVVLALWIGFLYLTAFAVLLGLIAVDLCLAALLVWAARQLMFPGRINHASTVWRVAPTTPPRELSEEEYAILAPAEGEPAGAEHAVLPAPDSLQENFTAPALAEVVRPDVAADTQESEPTTSPLVEVFQPVALIEEETARVTVPDNAPHSLQEIEGEVTLTMAACPPVATAGLYVASPRKDSRRSTVTFSYRPWTGAALKEGQFLALKEGKRYRRATQAELDAAA